MKELVFSGSKRSIKKLSKVQQSIDKFLKKQIKFKKILKSDYNLTKKLS